MCGRYGLYISAKEIDEYFRLDQSNITHNPSYNIAPTEVNPIIKLTHKHVTLVNARWGMVPKWKGSTKAPLLINSRIETMHDKKYFHDIFKLKRCIVPANGFFEWRQEKEKKHPYFFYPNTEKLFAFAGIYTEEDGIFTYSIITKPANKTVSLYHSRMPAILQLSDIYKYLDDEMSVSALLDLIDQDEISIKCHAVNPKVNSSRLKNSAVIIPANSA